MDVDEKVRIAEKIANELVDVRRSEWMKWVEYSMRHDLNKALKLADSLSKSPMRMGPKKTYSRIYKVIDRELRTLSEVSPNDMNEIFGYVSWIISIPSGFGAWKDE